MRTSIDDGWMSDSSSGSITIRPAASCSRMVRSDRITATHVSDGASPITFACGFGWDGSPESARKRGDRRAAAGSTIGGVYTPGPNAVDDPTVTLALLRSAGAGHLVSLEGDGTFDSTLLPFVVDDDLSTVRAHFARANPQWRMLDRAAVLLIVPVSSAYVSPSWYESKRDDPRVVPTWNYEVVHVHGTAQVRDDARFVESVVRSLTDLHEARRVENRAPTEAAVPPRWSLDDAPPDFIARQLRAIVGLEVSVTRVEAKRKLSQNRTGADRQGVIAGMSESSPARPRQVVDAMRADLAR